MNRKRFSTRCHSLVNDVMGLYLSQSRLQVLPLWMGTTEVQPRYNLDYEHSANQRTVFQILTNHDGRTTLETIRYCTWSVFSSCAFSGLLSNLRAVSGGRVSEEFDEKLWNFVQFFFWSGMPKPVAGVAEGKLVSRLQGQFYLDLLVILNFVSSSAKMSLLSLFQFGQLEWCNAFP